MKKNIVITILIICPIIESYSQVDTFIIKLETAIELANDSSLKAFIIENDYYISYLNYRNFEIDKYPTLNLNSTPFNYNRSITKQFNTYDTSYTYFEQQNLSSSVNLSVNQNILLTGGSVYLESNLDRVLNFRNNDIAQYSATPIRMGINQPIFGFNSFKWNRKIEQIKFKKAKQEYIQSTEELAVKTVGYFFNLVTAELKFNMTNVNTQNAEKLLAIAKQRYELGDIVETEFLILKLDLMNSKNEMVQAGIEVKRAHAALTSHLGLPAHVKCKLILPDSIPSFITNTSRVLDMAKEYNPFYLDILKQKLESQREVERLKIERRIKASINASVGLNRHTNDIHTVYKDLLDQERASISFSVPIIDWKRNKMNYARAKKNMEIIEYSNEQRLISLEEEVQISVLEFNLQRQVVLTAKEAAEIADLVFQISVQQFELRRETVNSLFINLERKETAIVDYYMEIEKYWRSYYGLRSLALYDFERNEPLISKDLGF